MAYHIIGGGEEGNKTSVRSKEQADHSLPYMVAAALLDDQVMPEQYRPERIQSQDIQDLLRRVTVRESPEFSRQFPDTMPCRVQVRLKSDATLTRAQHDYEGFHTRPMSWNTATQKFARLAEPFTSPELRQQISNAVATLEAQPVQTLIDLLAQVRHPERER